MRPIARVVVIALLALSAPALAQDDCEAARCAAQDALNACPCTVMNGKANHGQYVSCVAHVLKDLRDSGDIPTSCRGKIQRCAARSTCGKKEGFVICQIPTDTCNVGQGSCDPVTLTCVGNSNLPCGVDTDCGVCADDATLGCQTDLDCGSRCKISSSAERCAARNGVVDPTRTTCCADCSTP
jgi:hypothetical protein